jgi:hypothetical protein
MDPPDPQHCTYYIAGIGTIRILPDPQSIGPLDPDPQVRITDLRIQKKYLRMYGWCSTWGGRVERETRDRYSPFFGKSV